MFPNEVYSRAKAITPNDTSKLTAGATQAIYVGGAGNLVVDMASGDTNVTFSAVPAGTVLKISAIRVKTASTTTLMLALY